MKNMRLPMERLALSAVLLMLAFGMGSVEAQECCSSTYTTECAHSQNCGGDTQLWCEGGGWSGNPCTWGTFRCGCARNCGGCETCNPGEHQITAPALTRNRDCQACSAGWYTDRSNAEHCTECRAGTFTPSPTKSCQTCQRGHFSPGLTSACSLCASGMYEPDSGRGSCRYQQRTCRIGDFVQNHHEAITGKVRSNFKVHTCGLWRTTVFAYFILSSCSLLGTPPLCFLFCMPAYRSMLMHSTANDARIG